MPPKWLEMEHSSIQSVRRPSLLALQDARCLQEAFRWVRKRLAGGLSPHYQCKTLCRPLVGLHCPGLILSQRQRDTYAVVLIMMACLHADFKTFL